MELQSLSVLSKSVYPVYVRMLNKSAQKKNQQKKQFSKLAHVLNDLVIGNCKFEAFAK